MDKGKNAFVWFEVKSYLWNDGKRELAFVCYQSAYIKGLGGFGFKGKAVVPSPPETLKSKPDIVLKV